jgi:hypothetical protein
VTVDQLRVAKVHEIVAVTGLAEEVVASLVAALVGDARGPRSQPHGLDAVRSPPQEPDGLDAFLEAGAFASEDNETEGPDPEVPLLPTPRVHAGPRQDHEGGETLASKDALRAKLRRQVESEAALERIRCDVLRLKARTAGLRTDVGSARSRRDDMAKELDRLRSHLATRLAHLRELRQTTDARRQGLGDTSAKLEEAQARLNALQSRHRAATEERARFGQSVAELVQTLERMLKSRPADRPSAANDPDAP